ncbi:MAG: energy transducer TonB [Phycisphaerales bacterium]
MGFSRSRMAGTLGWAGSLGLHAGVWLSAVGVIPIAAGLGAIAESLDRRDMAPEPEQPTRDQRGLKTPPPIEVRVPEPEPAPSEDEVEPLDLTLGIDESTATDTDTWLGFAEATPEHGGAPLGYEQALLRRAPGERSATLDLEAGLGASDSSNGEASRGDAESVGDGGADDETREAFVAVQPQATITLARAPVEDDAGVTTDRAAATPGAGTTVIAQQAAGAVEAAREAIEALRRRGGEGIARAPESGGRPIDETAKPAADAEPLDESGAGGDEQVIGFLSDRDSDAAAIAQAVSINPGKPLAAKGLRIQTVRPKWSTYALATANPNDVVVRIWFDARGRVTEAKIIQSSGRSDVDRPIIDAVYNWRATGEQLRAIAQRPDQRAQLVFRIDLER